MIRPLLAALLLASPVAAFAQDDTAAGQPPQRIRSVTLTGDQSCPKGAADEIVVCSRINPGEQFRVPKELRNEAPIAAQNQSWVNRTAAADQVGRVAGGLPNTCSAVGTGGQTGCALAAARAWSAERRAAQANDAMVP